MPCYLASAFAKRSPSGGILVVNKRASARIISETLPYSDRQIVGRYATQPTARENTHSNAWGLASTLSSVLSLGTSISFVPVPIVLRLACAPPNTNGPLREARSMDSHSET